MAASIRAFDWASTRLGPIETWPASLSHIIDFMLASPVLASVADDLRRALTRLDATVIGPAPTLERVMDLIEDAERIDGAILDINLGGEMAFPAADLLADRGVPFLFATGYDKSVIPARFDHVARCEKPIAAEKVGSILTELIFTSSS